MYILLVVSMSNIDVSRMVYYVLQLCVGAYSTIKQCHASLMMKSGVNPKVVSERLGHSSIAVTMDIYSHVLPGLREAAAQRFAKLLKPKEQSNI